MFIWICKLIIRNIGLKVFILSCLLISEPGFIDRQIWAQNKTDDLEPRGSTHSVIEKPDLIDVGEAPVYFPATKMKKQKFSKPYHTITAPQSETNDFDLYIPAGGYFALKFNSQNKLLDLIYPEPENQFSQEVQTAIEKAPRWMKNDLINVFALLEIAYQDKWARAILDAEDPFVDEIAFCIAHLSPQYLTSLYASVELLELNAKLIYENDKYLNYVDVIDYGTSQTDPNYYTTTKYRKAKYTDTTEVEVPRDIYYWYIVHPKITDEIPAFIDPDIIESNSSHVNNITTPDKGHFWREFLFYNSDPGYAKFKDMVKDCKVVWNEFNAPGSGGAHAIEIMNRWQSASMDFTSNDERPHQPVRIYRKHIGRCGENGDMRVAIARSALIPCTSVASYSTDHVWNEFWDEEWIHWDGTINNPYMYIDGWGKEFGTVFRWRSDGFMSSVTPRYTRGHATLNIYALDSLDNPIDGARIILYTTGLYSPKAFDHYGFTDNSGKVTFLVGPGRSYWAKMSCDYGSIPSNSGEVLRVLGNSEAGAEYSVYMRIDAKKPQLSWNEIPVPQFKDNRYYLAIDVDVPSQILRGRDLFDDMNNGAFQFIPSENGKVNCFITDEPNYQSYLTGEEFGGSHSFNETDHASIGFEFDGSSNWYCIFDNSNSLHTLQHMVGSANLYSVYDSEVADVRILSNYPNPMNPQDSETTIMYQLPQKSNVELTIYNILGERVKTLINEIRYAGQFTINWDGRNEANQMVSSGIYLCRIKSDQGMSSRKMVVVR